jgi:L-threonylcarbamoyladenylate synthase
VQKIYAVKGRPPDNPLIVHFSNADEIYKYAEVPEIADKLIKKFISAAGAPLTLVLKKRNNKLDTACTLETIAVRVPENKTARKLIELAGVPIAAPSANLSGKPSPTNAEHIIKDLSGKVDMIICGENCKIGLESTVISFNINDNINNINDSLNILRTGFITREDLAEFHVRNNDNCDKFNKVNKAEDFEKPPSPGMKYKHYSPNAPLYILSGSELDMIDFVKKESESYNKNNKKIGFLCYDEMLEYFKSFEHIEDINAVFVVSIGSKNNVKEQAHNLFNALNHFNSLDADILYSIKPVKTKIGEAVYDRLIHAADGKIINV